MSEDTNVKELSADELYDRYDKFVWHIVFKYFKSQIKRIKEENQLEIEDLFQIGFIGLMKSRDRFDPTLGIRFTTFSATYIVGEIKRFMRDNRIIRVPRGTVEGQWRLNKKDMLGATVEEAAEFLGYSAKRAQECLNYNFSLTSLSKPLTLDDSGSGMFYEDIVRDELDVERAVIEKTMVAEVLATLTKRELEVYRLYFEKGLRQAEVGKRLGISQVQVSRLAKRILDKCETYGKRVQEACL